MKSAPVRVAALLAMLALTSCSDDEPSGPSDGGSGSQSGTVVNYAGTAETHFVSTDSRYAPAWTFSLRQQAPIPTNVREVLVEVRGCRQDYAPPGVFRYRTSEASAWREMRVDLPLCGAPGETSQQTWLPVGSDPKVEAEAVQPSIGVNSYVSVTVQVLSWKLP
ncbi:hypothetical protein [Stigmatella aurantiaca]|nr:hypothetical protein [Stigmatella aurantiaca]